MHVIILLGQNLITAQVILSSPTPWHDPMSVGRIYSNTCPMKVEISMSGFRVFNLLSKMVIVSYELKQSHIPSHAMTMKSISAARSTTMMSGKGVTACYSRVRLAFYLYSRSPMARLKAKDPSTLSYST